MKNKTLLSLTGVLLLGIILLLVNAVSKNLLERLTIDASADRLYTLSDGTRKIVSELDEPITLKYYFSKTDAQKYPGLKVFATRVAELLREYVRVGRGKISFEEFNPRPDSEEEEWAQKYGLTPLPLQEGDRVFWGLVAVNGAGEEQMIPAFNFQRENFLEYDITKLVSALSARKKPVVGVLSPLPLKGEELPNAPGLPQVPNSKEPWIFVTQLQQFAEVRFINMTDTVIDPQVTTLVVVHPVGISDSLLYSIDQFVLRGGHLFVAEDPYSQSAEMMGMQDPEKKEMVPAGSSLNRLLSRWGVEMTEGKVVADVNLASQVGTGQGAPPQEFLVWLSLSASQDPTSMGELPLGKVPTPGAMKVINRTDVTTSALENIMLAWPGVLNIKQIEGVTIEPLLATTTSTKLYDQADFLFGGGNPESLLNNFIPSGQQYVLAARISGKLKTNFPKGGPAAPAGPAANMTPASGATGHLDESTQPSNIIVVADADFLANRFSVVIQSMLGAKMISPLNDNQFFAENSVENLTGSSDLISLRSRGQASRPFTRVQRMAAEAQMRSKLDESRFQAILNAANQRLTQLQSAVAGESAGKQILDAALMDEVKRVREERKEAQRRLRELRRDLRQDIEGLGERLFLLNTFFVPSLLIFGTAFWYFRKGKRKAQVGPS